MSVGSRPRLMDEIMTVMPLGAGSEVGRSCIVIKFKGKSIMLDCGVHPAYSGLASLPFFDEIDPATIDAVLITHFHLDHVAALPYFTERTTFHGKVFMTHPTKAIIRWLLSDYVRVSSNASGEGGQQADQLYNEQELAACCERVQAVDYHQTFEPFPGLRVTALQAGHVLGAAMFMLEWAGQRILYTGDYSREEDRHLPAAEIPTIPPQVLICESTYGVALHQPQAERERRFCQVVTDIVKRGGRCLIPVFALGRAQELLLILDEHWQQHRDLHSIPIHYASPLANKSMAIYQTYLNMMNERVRRQAAIRNPFLFRHIGYLRSPSLFRDAGPCVVMASPGMLQSGFSRDLLERWAPNRANGIVIPGYVVEGTMGKEILNEPREIHSLNGSKAIPLRATVESISFSAHVDYAQNSAFIEALAPAHLILVHGEQAEMHRLRAALEQARRRRAKEAEELQDQAEVAQMTIHCPRNCEAVEIAIGGDRPGKIIGRLVHQLAEQHEALFVEKDYEYQVMLPADLTRYTGLRLCSVSQRQAIKSRAPVSLVLHAMVCLVGEAEVKMLKAGCQWLISDRYAVACEDEQDGIWVVEWESDPMADLLADSIISLIVNAEHTRASVREIAKHSRCSHGHDHASHDDNHASESAEVVREYLESIYGPVTLENGLLCLSVDGEEMQVNVGDLTVSSQSDAGEGVQRMLNKLKQVTEPVPFI